MIRFILSLLVCSLIIYGLTNIFLNTGYVHALPTYFLTTLVFLNVSTILIYYYLIRSGNSSFVQGYLLTMVLKLLAYCGYNIAIILSDRENAGINVGFFLITYLIFTTLELAFLYRRMGR